MHDEILKQIVSWVESKDSGRIVILASTLVFVFTLVARIHGVSQHFLLLGDQIRDWAIALRPFSALPLVGPPTHFGGYNIGPAFYWILWIVRVLFGPWFDNLPHAGGIGQAALQSAADALLLVAIWRRTGSWWIALATVVIVATAAFDVSLAAVVWNPLEVRTCMQRDGFGPEASFDVTSRYHVPNYRYSTHTTKFHIPVGTRRGVGQAAHEFSRESFINELAHAAGKDPYLYRPS